MVAELYILSESFANNVIFSNAEIEEKVKSLAYDFVQIKKHKDTNKLFVHPDIYNVEFLKGVTLAELLYDPITAKRFIDRDVYNALKTIVIESATTNNSTQEVIDVLLPEHNYELCHGLIAFNEVPNVEMEFQIVYNLNSWFRFRRHFLGIYPKDPNFFIDECAKYFNSLYFHIGNKNSTADILNDFSKNIVKHLGYLNDVFYTYRQRHFDNETIKYQTFTSECNLEADAASKDKNAAKAKLTFEFINDKGVSEQIVCYPHLRLCNSDNTGDGHHYQHRIYFHEGMPHIQNGKILIGYIGVHL